MQLESGQCDLKSEEGASASVERCGPVHVNFLCTDMYAYVRVNLILARRPENLVLWGRDPKR
jgi:hypothetical protein